MGIEYQRVKNQPVVVQGEYPSEQRANIEGLIEYEEEHIELGKKRCLSEEEVLRRIKERYSHESNPENHGLCVLVRNGVVIAQNMLWGLNSWLIQDRQEHPRGTYLVHRLGEAVDFELIGEMERASCFGQPFAADYSQKDYGEE